MKQFPSISILGQSIHMTRFADAVAFAEAWIREGRRQGYICHVSVHGIIEAQDDPAFAEALRGACLAATDGMPLVWMGHARGLAAERVYGPDYMRAVLQATARWTDRPCRHFLFGSTPEVLERLSSHVAETYPSASVVGTLSPPFRTLTPEEERAHQDQINASGADIVWVGLGAPKQEIWMARNRPHLRAPLLIGVGAAFDFLGGVKVQAPAWIRANGLEWAFRLVTEPRRLAPRYGTIIPRFMGLVAKSVLTGRAGG